MAGGVRTVAGWTRVEAGINGAYWIFTGLLVVQALHMFEHAAQVHQYFLAVANPRGFLGAWFDFVWVHFAFNVSVFLAILAAWWMWLRHGEGWQHNKRGARWFTALLWFQGYHATEHVLQMVQYLSTGDPKPPGLIGRVLPNPIAHFDLNLVLLVLLAGVALTLRPRRMKVMVLEPSTAARPAAD